MKLTRWEPMREMMTMREVMDRMFDESFVRAARGGGNGRRNGSVPLELVERDQEIVVNAAVPGFTPEQIDIDVHGDVLTIKGRVEHTETSEEDSVHVREWRAESFQRAVRLPSSVDADSADASYKNGVLTVTLPKRAEAVTKRISVSG